MRELVPNGHMHSSLEKEEDLMVKYREMTPTVFSMGGFRFFFFSREEVRTHVHVIGHGGEAKFWLDPMISLAVNYGLSPPDLREAQRLIEEHEDEIRSAWQEHFGG